MFSEGIFDLQLTTTLLHRNRASADICRRSAPDVECSFRVYKVTTDDVWLSPQMSMASRGYQSYRSITQLLQMNCMFRQLPMIEDDKVLSWLCNEVFSKSQLLHYSEPAPWHVLFDGNLVKVFVVLLWILQCLRTQL